MLALKALLEVETHVLFLPKINLVTLQVHFSSSPVLHSPKTKGLSNSDQNPHIVPLLNSPVAVSTSCVLRNWLHFHIN